jgi:hypothetical protein
MIPGRPLIRIVVTSLLLAALGLVAVRVFAENTDPRGENPLLVSGLSGSRYAWGENAGWIKARPAGEVYGPGGTGLQVTDTGLRGYLWGENIGWINLSCQNNATCATVNFGVTNDGSGNLAGYGWAENAGWINFSCNTNSTCANVNYGVTIDPNTGQFHGRAWAENLGWVSFNCADTASCGNAQYGLQTGWPDSDGDACRDSRENGPDFIHGGQRDMWDPWDFYDVPAPALRLGFTGQKQDSGIGVTTDVVALLKYAGLTSDKPDYIADNDGDGTQDGIQYDRSLVDNSPTPWRSGPPDGGIGVTTDVVAMLRQSGNFCTG